jgi:hypothetical protein
MIKRVEGKLIEALIKAKIGEWIAKLFYKLKGNKTEIVIILVAIIKFCIYSNIIPSHFVPVANKIVESLYPVMTITFGDKVRRYWESIKKVGDDIIK